MNIKSITRSCLVASICAMPAIAAVPVFADSATTQSAGYMGSYVATMGADTSMMQLMNDQKLMMTKTVGGKETKSEGVWLLDGDTLTIMLTSEDGNEIKKDDQKKMKYVVSDHGDTLKAEGMPTYTRKS